MFGPEKGLLGVEKKIKSEIEKERERENLPWWRILIREATASHGAGLTRTRRSEPTPSFFLFSERVIESEEAGMRVTEREKKSEKELSSIFMRFFMK